MRSPKSGRGKTRGAGMRSSRRDHRVAHEASAPRCELRQGGVGARPATPTALHLLSPAHQPLTPAGQRWPPGRAGPRWTGIDRHPDKSIDFCTEKLIDLLLAPWTRERPAGEAGTRGSEEAAHLESPWIPSTRVSRGMSQPSHPVELRDLKSREKEKDERDPGGGWGEKRMKGAPGLCRQAVQGKSSAQLCSPEPGTDRAPSPTPMP